MPSRRTWPAAVVTPSRIIGPVAETVTSDSAAPVVSVTVTVSTAVAEAAARGR